MGSTSSWRCATIANWSRARSKLVPFDFQFDMARAVKSEEELAEVRDAMDIILDGFWALVAAYRPGKTEAEIMAPAVERFFARGAGPRMMNILLSGEHGEADAYFKVPGHRTVRSDDLLLYSLEITGAGGYWVEFSRPLIQGKPSAITERMAEAYPEALEAARKIDAGRRAGQQRAPRRRRYVRDAWLFARTPLRTFDWDHHDRVPGHRRQKRSAARRKHDFLPAPAGGGPGRQESACTRKTPTALASARANAWPTCPGNSSTAKKPGNRC